MSSTHTKFSRNVFNAICNFLPEKSIVELRQVCKSANEFVCSIVTTRRTEIDCLSISQLKNLFLWRLYIVQTLHQLDLNLSDAIWSHYFTNRYLNICLPHDDVGRLLEYLKHIVKHTKFGDVRAIGKHHLLPKIVQMCSGFLDGKNLHGVFIDPIITRYVQFTPWLDLLQKVKCVHVSVQLELNRGTKNSMFQLANMVTSMSLLLSGSKYSRDIVVPCIKTILQRKCQKLNFRYKESPISTEDAESLLNFIYHPNKKINLTVWVSSMSWNAQVGHYKLSSTFYRLLAIKHVEN